MRSERVGLQDRAVAVPVPLAPNRAWCVPRSAFTGQFSAVDSLLTGEENLLLMADLNHLGRAGAGGALLSCSTGSIWSTRLAGWRPPIRVACGAGWTCDLATGGVTIFTQYLEEADRVAVLHRGTLVADGSAIELTRLVPGGHIQLRFDNATGMRDTARALGATLRDARGADGCPRRRDLDPSS